MKRTLNIRYIPGWLSVVLDHHNASASELDRIVSSHDRGSFQLANNQLRARLQFLDISDFVFPDAEVVGDFSEDDVLFALFGANSKDKSVNSFMPTQFRIIPDQYSGIVVLEDTKQPVRCLVAALLDAFNTYMGREAAQQSSLFVRFLKDVKKYTANPLLALDEIGAKRYMTRRNVKSLSDHPLMLGDPTPPLNT